MEAIQHIELSQIDEPQALNGRIDRDQDKLTELQNAIATNGLIHPITLRRKGKRYELVAGAGRLECYKRLGRNHIPAIVRDLNDLKAATLRLAENYARASISPVEEAAQLSDLVEQHPDAVDGVARIVNHRPEWVLDRLDILTWPEALQQAVHTRKISLSAARILARIPDQETRDLRIADATHHGINAATASLWLQNAQGQPPAESPPPENSSTNAREEYRSTTTAACFGCRTRNDITTMRPRILCDQCCHALQQAHSSMPTDAAQPQIQSLGAHDHPYDAYHMK